MCETYNGWKNRETWALNLWLTNDQGLYEMTRERVSRVITTALLVRRTSAQAARIAGEAFKEWWDELTDPDESLMTTEAILAMVKDVGSDYRVNWDEIGAFWLSDLSES